MKHEKTTGIVLNRTNFGEADRILTIITPDHGKLRLIAKGVRKEKSKLAGGIELFSTSNISYIPGKRDISTVVSTRLIKHYGRIVTDMERTMLGYDLLKLIDKHTQDSCEGEYFNLLEAAFKVLDDSSVSTDVIKTWFIMRLLNLLGRTPNLQTDTTGQKLAPNKKYQFDYEAMCFMPQKEGQFTEKHIKYLRLLTTKSPTSLQTITDAGLLAKHVQLLLQSLLEFNA